MAHVLVFCVSVHACGGMVLSEQLHQDEDEGLGTKGSRSVLWWGRGRPGQAGVVCRWTALAEWGLGPCWALSQMEEICVARYVSLCSAWE